MSTEEKKKKKKKLKIVREKNETINYFDQHLIEINGRKPF